MSRVVSVRVPREVVERLEKLGVNVAGEVRRFLESLAFKDRRREAVENLRRVCGTVVLRPARLGEAVGYVRDGRESR